MKKSLLAVVFLAAGVSFASAQTKEKTKKVKTSETVLTAEVKADSTVDGVAATPTFKKEGDKVSTSDTTSVSTEASPAIKQETTTEIKKEEPAVKP